MKGALVRFGLAVSAAIGAIAAERALWAVVARTPLVLPIAGVLVASLLGGVLGGVVAAALAGFALRYALPAPLPSAVLALYAFLATITVALGEGVRIAFERARALRDNEARLRALAERAAILADASALLGSTLDVDGTLPRLAALLVPRAGRACALVVDADGVAFGTNAGLEKADEERVAAALDAAKASGTSEVSGDVLAAPLRIRGKTLGAIALLGGADLPLLEDIARRTAVALDHAALHAKAQEAVRARDQFFSVASHELRSPLSTLCLQLEALERALEKGADLESTVQRMGGLRRTVSRMRELIEEMLDTTAIRAGRLELRRDRLDLGALARDVVERFELEASVAGSALWLQADEPVVGRFDRSRIEQVLANLISNALKYGHGKPVDVVVDGVEGRARIRVRDRGIGIAKADQARVFEPFERTLAARSKAGLGLGLYIVRQIVSAHGGTISLDSEPDRGTEVTVELPLQDGATLDSASRLEQVH